MSAADKNEELKKWETTSTKTVFQAGKWLTVEQHAVVVSPKLTIPDWTWVVSPHFVNVAVVTRDTREWLLFRQTKYALGYSLGDDEVLGMVGGYVEAEEMSTPLAAAKPELRCVQLALSLA
jgi:hypothetical protein